MDEHAVVDCQFVGMDLHRRRSVLVRMNRDGDRLETIRILNDRDRLAEVIARAGESPEVVLEATYGWYWAADALAEMGATVHLAHPLGVKGFSYRRVKNDERDAADLADLLRMHRLPEGWIAPLATRDLRELVQHRAKLVHLRTSLRQQIHALLAANGITIPVSDLFGVAGNQLLDRVQLSPAARSRVISLRRLLDALDVEIDAFSKLTTKRLRGVAGYKAVQSIPGVGPILGAVFLAEIGDVTRFPGPQQLASPTPPCAAAGSPSRAAFWSAGLRSRPLNAQARTPAPGNVATRSHSAAAATSSSPPPPAICSGWSTTRCATATCAACRPAHDQHDQRHRPAGRGPLCV